MFPLRENPSKLTIPGTYTISTLPESTKPTVVKLVSGEKVHLISGKPTWRHSSSFNPEILHAIPSGRHVDSTQIVVRRERPFSYAGPAPDSLLQTVLSKPSSPAAQKHGDHLPETGRSGNPRTSRMGEHVANRLGSSRKNMLGSSQKHEPATEKRMPRATNQRSMAIRVRKDPRTALPVLEADHPPVEVAQEANQSVQPTLQPKTAIKSAEPILGEKKEIMEKNKFFEENIELIEPEASRSESESSNVVSVGSNAGEDRIALGSDYGSEKSRAESKSKSSASRTSSDSFSSPNPQSSANHTPIPTYALSVASFKGDTSSADEQALSEHKESPNEARETLLQDLAFSVFDDSDEPLEIHSFRSRNVSLPTNLGVLDTVSPYAGVSFSPVNRGQGDPQVQIALTLQEIVQSEHMFIKSLTLLRNFFVEPLLVKCVGMQITCTPLLHMDTILQALIAKHDDFYSHMAQAMLANKTSGQVSKLHSYALLAQKLFVDTSYGDYSAYAELILTLVERQISPFDSPYIKGLQRFLEQNQPKARCMDLSISSLLQKPMGRIAKYQLFLTALQKSCPDDMVIGEASDALNAGLNRINLDISTSRQKRVQTRALVPKSTAVSVENFGIMRGHMAKAQMAWLVHERRRGAFELVSRHVALLFFDYHLVVLSRRQDKTLFVIAASSCISGSVEDDGLCTSDENTVKVRFQKSHCFYEVLFKAETSETYQAFVDHMALLSTNQPDTPSDGDTSIDIPIAPCDLVPGQADTQQNHSSTCYFGKTHEANFEASNSRFRSIAALRNCRLW